MIPQAAISSEFEHLTRTDTWLKMVDRARADSLNGIVTVTILDELNEGIHLFGEGGFLRRDLSLARIASVRAQLPTELTTTDPQTGQIRRRSLDLTNDADLAAAWQSHCDQLVHYLRNLKALLRYERRQNPKKSTRDRVEAFTPLLQLKDPAEFMGLMIVELLAVRRAARSRRAKAIASRDLAIAVFVLLCGFRPSTLSQLCVGKDISLPLGQGRLRFHLRREIFKNRYSELLRHGLNFVLPEAVHPAGFDPNRALRDYLVVWRPLLLERLGGANDHLFLPANRNQFGVAGAGLATFSIYDRITTLTALLLPKLAPVGICPSDIRTLSAGTLFLHGYTDEARYLLLDAPATLLDFYLVRFFGRRNEQHVARAQELLFGKAPAEDLIGTIRLRRGF